MINKGCLEAIKFSEWEQVLFPKPESAEDQRRLKAFKRASDKYDRDARPWMYEPEEGA